MKTFFDVLVMKKKNHISKCGIEWYNIDKGFKIAVRLPNYQPILKIFS